MELFFSTRKCIIKFSREPAVHTGIYQSNENKIKSKMSDLQREALKKRIGIPPLPSMSGKSKGYDTMT